jgi:aspartate aminotransferase
LDSQTFAERLIDSQAVATVPGCSFGADANIRLSYACSMDEIEEGVRRIKSESVEGQ